jgi:hypothetical protein
MALALAMPSGPIAKIEVRHLAAIAWTDHPSVGQTLVVHMLPRHCVAVER